MSGELTVSLVPDETLLSTLRADEGALTIAQAYDIDSAEMAEQANKELKNVKARLVWLRERKAGFVQPARVIIANAEALFDGAINANVEAEALLKTGLNAFVVAEANRVAEAKRIADAAALKAHQDAEAEAARVRARAEEQAAEQRRLAAKAEEDRKAALAAGDAKAAAKAAGDAAALAEKANATVENAEAKASTVLTTAAAAAQVPTIQAAKITGYSTRDNWGAELASGTTEQQALAAIVAAIASGRSDLVSLLQINWVAAKALAKAQKLVMAVPGLVAKNTPSWILAGSVMERPTAFFEGMLWAMAIEAAALVAIVAVLSLVFSFF